MLLIHAPNVHQGGGRTLLLSLLEAAAARTDVRAIVDARLALPPDVAPSCIAARVRPTVAGRLRAEWMLRSLLRQGDVLLCFGNLPPLFHVRGRVAVFLQNRYLLAPSVPDGLPMLAQCRIAVERRWLRSRLSHVHELIVQTPSMAREVEQELRVRAVVVPFAPRIDTPARSVPAVDLVAARASFLYVASGEPHKNHRNLLTAWRLLAEDGLRPELHLTVSPEAAPALCAELDAFRARHGLAIENTGTLTASELDMLYARCSALIYPSTFESFGLPLLEAHQRGVPVLAPELDYVRDVIEPVETFDPHSPLSIARAVKRFLKRPEAVAVVRQPREFLDHLIAAAREST